MPDYSSQQPENGSDPGWRPALRLYLPTLLTHVFFFGIFALFRARRSHDGLTLVRALYLSFLTTPILITLVTAFIMERTVSNEGWIAPTAVALTGLCIILPRLVRTWKLNATDAEAFGAWYRSSFFLAFALCQAPFLMSFVLCFIVDALLPLLIVLSGLYIGMLSITPNRRNLGNLQDRVAAAGSSVDVIAAIKQLPPLPRRA